jgi:hydroxymethylglutaryl-CoA reductase
MTVEEPSVIAAASNAALVARAGGGFKAEADPGAMIGQIQLIRVRDPQRAVARLESARAELLASADALTPGLCRRGAGPRDIEIRLVKTPRGETMVVVHFLVDTGDAMGANAVNSLVETLAPRVAELAEGEACLRILSNLADRRLARSAVRVPCRRSDATASRARKSPSGCSTRTSSPGPIRTVPPPTTRAS